MSAKKVAAQNLNKIINKFRFSGGVFCSPIVVQNESPRILTKERGIWRNVKVYTDRYFRKVALIVIDNGMSNNNKANQ